MNDLLAAATLGLLGSAHCAGMCGGFYVIAGRKGWARRIPYLLGKTMTYVLLGGIAASIGSMASSYARIGSVLTVSIGIGLVVGGLVWMGVVPRLRTNGRFSERVGRIIGRILGRADSVTPLMLGLANGFLPCGLTMGAVMLAAATADTATGMAMMAVFGIATIPGLALFGMLVQRFGSTIQRRSHLIGGVALVAFGAFTILRAFMVMNHAAP